MSRNPAGPKARGRPKAADALAGDEILAVALRTFATHGYEGVSLRTINRELGASHNLIYQRFGTKEELWKAAVDYGFGGLVDYARSGFDPTIADPLEQLRLAVRRFVLYSADHPELLALMSIEGRQSTERLRYIYDTYIEPSQRPLARLMTHLADEGKIRAIPYRTFFFLFVHGGASSFTLDSLATLFDPSHPSEPRSAEQQADLVATIIIEGLRLPDPSSQ
ncbi:TetR/AcrR family transcriptional regulator [Mycolicibacterium sp.]|uniref:TetR/AcrR family transcriptional regulator n=1 Tax=Mycolicibacterium sp. TaxID=2320850 RepID=UPI0028A5C402|nr:TetR/AcrR family transcriptional regulator [Mycolicibacterium sp.]